jgi:Zn-dependent peptidase ImmA (M78 family)
VFEWQLPSKMSGLSYQRDFSVIFVNRGMPERVKLFTLCHEVAHLLFHLRGKCETEVSVMATRNDPHEKQANRFAAELLMPGDKLDAVIREQGAALRTKAGFLTAVERFGVSHGAMFYRLAQRNLVRYTEKSRLFVEQARPADEAHGARVGNVKEQLPGLVLDLVARLWFEEKISIGKAAEWCMAKRSAMEAHLAAVAEDGAPVDDIDLGYGEVEGLVE